MKKLLYFIMGCVVVGLILSTVLTLIPKFRPAATAFLFAISKTQYGEAYDLFTDDFKKENSIDIFKTVIHENHLDQYKQVEWLKEGSPDKDHTYVMGIMFTNDKKRIPIAVYFVKVRTHSILEQGWRIQGFETGDAVLKKMGMPHLEP